MHEQDKYISELSMEYPELENCAEDIKAASKLITACYIKRGKLLTCGNGGSCSDAGHIVGEMMKSFETVRPLKKAFSEKLIRISLDRGHLLAEKLEQGLPAISLNAHEALLSAVLNDIGGDFVFAQQVVGYGQKGDVLLAISSSGNSQNVVDAAITAKAMDLYVVGLTGESGGKLKKYCDLSICVPASETRKIQEYHLPIYHAICRSVEKNIFGSKGKIINYE